MHASVDAADKICIKLDMQIEVDVGVDVAIYMCSKVGIIMEVELNNDFDLTSRNSLTCSCFKSMFGVFHKRCL